MAAGETAAGAQRRRSEMWLKWYLWFSAVVLVVLSVVVVILVSSNSQRITADHHNNVEQCQLANVTREQDIAIWNRILHLPPEATAAQKQEVKDLERLVKIKDTPRDCTAAFRP